MSFKHVLNILKEEKKKSIPQVQIKKISNSVRKFVGTKAADKWDDPDEFLNKLIDGLEEQGLTPDEFNVKTLRGRFSNKRSDHYLELDKGSSGIEFTDENGKVGYVQVSWYNDPGKNHDTRYEMNYYFN